MCWWTWQGRTQKRKEARQVSEIVEAVEQAVVLIISGLAAALLAFGIAALRKLAAKWGIDAAMTADWHKQTRIGNAVEAVQATSPRAAGAAKRIAASLYAEEPKASLNGTPERAMLEAAVARLAQRKRRHRKKEATE